jgi:P-type Ca2+ transporter type 2C
LSRRRADQPWQRDAAEVVRALGADMQAGLTAAEAARRLQHYGPNELEAEEPVPAWRQFLGRFADPLIYLLIAAAVVAIAAWRSTARRVSPSTRS